MRSPTSRILRPLKMAMLREVAPVKPAGVLRVPPREPQRPERALRLPAAPVRPPAVPVRPPDSSAAFVQLWDRTNAAYSLRGAVPTQASHYAVPTPHLARLSQVWADRPC